MDISLGISITHLTRYSATDGDALESSPIPRLVPDLAVEVLSASNTTQEMNRKLQKYLATGTQFVWYVAPEMQRITIYTAPEQWVELGVEDVLDGGNVLPGLQ
jgi:Uma2 family endonuclease